MISLLVVVVLAHISVGLNVGRRVDTVPEVMSQVGRRYEAEAMFIIK